MRLLKSEMTWDAYHGAAPEIEVTVRSEDTFDELRRAIKRMNRRRARRGGSRRSYLIQLVG